MIHEELVGLHDVVTQEDSLDVRVMSDSLLEVLPDSLARSVDALRTIEVFGPHSALAESVEVASAATNSMQFISGNFFFELLLLICFISYTVVIYRFRGEITSLMSIFRGDVFIGKLLDDQNFVFDFFLRSVIGLGMLVCGLAVIKFTDMYWVDPLERVLELLEWMGVWRSVVITIGLWVILCLIWTLQTLILRLVAIITPAGELIEDIVMIRRLFLAILTIIITPLVLILALSSGISSQVISIITLILTVSIAIFAFTRTYKLFMGQKISISYWILYLCGVEVFPLSFLVFLALRNT